MKNPFVQFEVFIERAKVFALICFYLFLCLSTLFLAAFPLIAIFVCALLALAKDKDREANPTDTFRGDRLFFRYGQETNHFVIPIPVHREWGEDEAGELSSRLRSGLASAAQVRLASTESVQVNEDLRITDVSTRETKSFMRVLVRSKYGSALTHFVHFAAFGKTVTAHYFTYVRGTATGWDTFKFILASPFSIWFWGLPWLANEHSILAQISRFRASSFDGIDIETMHSLTHDVIFRETEMLLKDAGLLTDEVRQTLHTHFHTRQSITVAHSSSVVIGPVSQALSAEAGQQEA